MTGEMLIGLWIGAGYTAFFVALASWLRPRTMYGPGVEQSRHPTTGALVVTCPDCDPEGMLDELTNTLVDDLEAARDALMRSRPAEAIVHIDRALDEVA